MPRVDLTRLEAELEGAVLDCLGGDPWGQALKGRIETQLKAVLYRHGLKRFGVRVWNPGDGVHVDVRLPPPRPGVQEVVLSVRL